MRKNVVRFEEVVIEKLVHGGQGLGTLPDGRKVFLWNALPGEKVRARITRAKKDFCEGIAEEILIASKDRVAPKESIFLATSPWQVLEFGAENMAKSQILKEAFTRENIDIDDVPMITDNLDFGYRNKIEFSFFGDDDGIHFAFYNRGSHQKQIVIGSALAMPCLNRAGQAILASLNKLDIRAGDLKTVILRCDQQGNTVAALFVKTKDFAPLPDIQEIKGLKIYYSNPKSPASVATKLLFSSGDTLLGDDLGGTEIKYDVTGFFQVNIPVFTKALQRIDEKTKAHNHKIDMYAGVGSIGIPIGGVEALIELDPANTKLAKINAENHKITVIQASSEDSLDYITHEVCLIVDPPRSGLHKDVIERILDVKPAQICYLSCNPSTQARDVALLKNEYNLSFTEGYNFFPRTPHIECLCILERK
ncbi:MAG: TRAM domain-containing protein [Candidatus Saccharibacteria bacterium]|nr:TRAM domain-containing protein [Candidatus Saccharibacteria bacterium]